MHNTEVVKYCQNQFGFILPSELIANRTEKFNSKITAFKLCIKQMLVILKRSWNM